MPRISGVRGFELSKAHTAKQRNGQDTAKKLSAGRDLSTVAQWHTGMCVCVCVCVCVSWAGAGWATNSLYPSSLASVHISALVIVFMQNL